MNDLPTTGRFTVAQIPMKQTSRISEISGFEAAEPVPQNPTFKHYRQMWKTDIFQNVYGGGAAGAVVPSFEQWLVEKLDAATRALPLSKSELETAIGYDPIHASWTDSTGPHGIVTHMAAKDRDLIVNKILKAQERKNG